MSIDLIKRLGIFVVMSVRTVLVFIGSFKGLENSGERRSSAQQYFHTFCGVLRVLMLMLPLVFIGVVWGLLLFGKSLDFFANLGLLGLIGMNIKNAIVLVDEIGLQLKDGKGAVPAVVEATKTRIVPVTMASGTTILGMLPLLGDAMFAGMAATIMGGLFVSTVLTIFVLPVTYCIFFKIRADR